MAPFRLTLLALLAAAFLVAGAEPAQACRCAQLPLERYFERADIVVVGRATAVRPVNAEGQARLEISVAPQFRPEPTFKGSLNGMVLATPQSSAACGVEVKVGEIYVIFAARRDVAQPQLAWFDLCSGSRRYPSNDPKEEPAFIGVENRRVLVRLFELERTAKIAPPGQEPAQETFHTSPECWSEPRIYHTGTAPLDVHDRIRITWENGARPETGLVLSPNRAYRAWSARDTNGSIVWVDVERPMQLRIALRELANPSEPQWANEKLLFLRLAWGRTEFTDVLIDVEHGRTIYEESARDGTIAFQQYRESCQGQCPCQPLTGSNAELQAPPTSRPAAGEEAGLAKIERRDMAYLDEDWDGRVFTEAGGRRYVLSSLKGRLSREEYPANVTEVRRLGADVWFHVQIFERSPCYDPNQPPAHTGWIPAFSARGRLAAGTYPGGC